MYACLIEKFDVKLIKDYISQNILISRSITFNEIVSWANKFFSSYLWNVFCLYWIYKQNLLTYKFYSGLITRDKFNPRNFLKSLLIRRKIIYITVEIDDGLKDFIKFWIKNWHIQEEPVNIYKHITLKLKRILQNETRNKLAYSYFSINVYNYIKALLKYNIFELN